MADQALPAADEATEEPRKGPSQAAVLLQLVEHVEFFHDPHGTGYATFTVDDHRETSPIRTRAFRSYIERLFYETEGKPPSSQPVQDALGVMDGRARFAGDEHTVHVRVAGDDEAIYIDLGSSDGSAIAITGAGWELVANPPVKFRRPKGMAALPIPSRNVDLARLRTLINVSDAGWPLIVGWILGALRPAGPFPVLASYGEQGSAKSTTQRIVRSMIDPSTAPLRSAPRNEHELVIAARNNYVIGFDNASSIQPWLSDALARISTGAGFAVRQLYTDSEEMIFDESRPTLINGIEEVVSRPDLLDRALIIEHPRISPTQRSTEAYIMKAVDAAHPVILGAVLDAVAAALKNLDSVELDELPRMADFCTWVVASEPALGWEPGRFINTYADNRESAHEVALDASPITTLMHDLAEQGFLGTASELLATLNELADEGITRSRSWPRSARGLSGSLRRLAPNLREVGVLIEFERGGNRRTISVRTGTRLKSDSTVTTVTTVTNGLPTDDANDANDGCDGRIPIQSCNDTEASPEEEVELARISEKFGMAI